MSRAPEGVNRSNEALFPAAESSLESLALLRVPLVAPRLLQGELKPLSELGSSLDREGDRRDALDDRFSFGEGVPPRG